MDHLVVGTSKVMARVSTQIDEAVKTESVILLLGPSGSGKEQVAREIHQRSQAAGSFVVADCAGTPKWNGYLADAKDGTLLLDEVGDVSAEAQAQLLRMVSVKSNARIIAATQVDLDKAVTDGKFRNDLHSRLTQFVIHIPPLSDHLEDISEIIGAASSARWGTCSYEWLEQRVWPGNVRQLLNVVNRLAMTEEEITADLLERESDEGVLKGIVGPLDTSRYGFEAIIAAAMSAPEGTEPFLDRVRRECIARTLKETGNNMRRAAEQLGVPRRTLADRMRRQDSGIRRLIRSPKTRGGN